ncbi:hypothetical protein SPONN_1110 [uncultured Candidatus Thioglobus sp.]|nr:hypothetical protein SPONN_1110 [uncultured Candidatus Thioglobus sp.]
MLMCGVTNTILYRPVGDDEEAAVQDESDSDGELLASDDELFASDDELHMSDDDELSCEYSNDSADEFD